MESEFAPKMSRAKMREHRKRLHLQGLHPIEIWMPDVRSPVFRAEAHRQSVAASMSAGASKDQAFVDAISDWGDERGEE